MNYDVNPDKAKAALDAFVAEHAAQNTPEARAKRDAEKRARKFARGMRYQRDCDRRDAMVLGAKGR